MLLFRGEHLLNMKMYRFALVVFALYMGSMLHSCKVFDKGSEPYDAAWEEVVDSGSWKGSFQPVSGTTTPGEIHYAIPDYSPLESPNADAEFLKRYPAMVSRAYFRLISEAMDADQRISKSYQDLYRRTRLPQAQKNRILQQEFEVAEKRFLAHREMLDGLRSWNAFNDFGSDDLDFFMQEELEVSYEKYERGVQEDQLIDYLMRRLADLYHKKYGGPAPDEILPG
jgi:hypothetical protein